jgi:endonuclease IV
MSMAQVGPYEEGGAHCPICWERRVRQYAQKRHVVFHEGIYEHVGENPTYIHSAQQLRDECSRNDNRSVYLEDMGGLFRTKGNRWI